MTRWLSKEQKTLRPASPCQVTQAEPLPIHPSSSFPERASMCVSEAALEPPADPSGRPWLSSSPGLKPNRGLGFPAALPDECPPNLAHSEAPDGRLDITRDRNQVPVFLGSYLLWKDLLSTSGSLTQWKGN